MKQARGGLANVYAFDPCSGRRRGGRDGAVCAKPYPGKNRLPPLTLAANIIGAVLIGFIAGIAETRDGIPPGAVLFWKTGVCGGFTTFSTFSLEALALLERKAYFAGGAYIALSVACCIAGTLCGKRAAMML